MSRKISVLLVLALLLAGISNVTVRAADKTKIVFWSNSRHDQTYMMAQVEEFNKTNPDNIEVEYVVNTEDYPQLVELAWQSNEGPDLVITRPLNVDKLVKAKFLEPLDSYLTNDMKEEIGQTNLVEGSTLFGGKLYTLPLYASTFRLIYNKDLFDKAGIKEPPKTLDQMVDYAKKITEAAKDQEAYGFAINLKTPANAWNRSLVPIARRSGINGYDFKTGKFDFSVYKPILMAFKQMVDDGSMFPSYQSLDIDPLRSQFAEGKIGMYLSISAEPGVYANQFKTDINWAAAPVPTVEDQPKGAANLGRSDWLGMSAQSKNKDAAWKVMQWFYRPDFVKGYHEQGFGISVLPSILKLAKIPTLKGIEYFMPDKTDATWPVEPVAGKIEGKDSNAVFAEIVFGVETDPDAALKDLSDRYNTAYEATLKGGKPLTITDFDPIKLQGE